MYAIIQNSLLLQTNNKQLLGQSDAQGVQQLLYHLTDVYQVFKVYLNINSCIHSQGYKCKQIPISDRD